MSTRIRIDPTDRIAFGGVSYTASSSSSGGLNLRRVDMDGLVEKVPADQVPGIWNRSDFRHERGYYSETGPQNPENVPAPTVSTLNDRDKKIVLYRHAYVENFLRLLAERPGTYARTYASARAAAIALQPTIDALGHFSVEKHQLEGRSIRKRKGRVGGTMLEEGQPPVVKRNPPSGETLLKWERAYRRSGGDPMSLKPQYGRCGFHGSHLDAEVESIIIELLPGYLSPQRQTKTEYLEAVRNAVKDQNKKLAAQGEKRRLPLPGKASINRAINGLSPYYVMCCRYGEAYAKKAYPWVTEGLKINIPGQRVEIDAYQCDVMTLMRWSAFSQGLTDKQKAQLKRKRMWLTIAIDRATRCIVGMRLSDTDNTPNAIAAIEMVESDKTIYTRHAGTTSPWHHRCGIMTVVADGGYVSDEFRTALVDARATLEFTQAGEPTMRAVVERIFRTVAMGLMSRLKGRTFSNIFERGDYNSEGHAGLTPDELALILVTWVVDIYHNTPHEGLGGKTPNRAWDEAVEKYGVHPWRDAHGRRSAFGVRLKRKLTRGGFEVLGNLYQDEDPEGLRHHYFNSHNPEFEIALDVTNLGAISVLIDEKAIMVPCKDPKMEGVHAAEWVQTTEFLRRQNDLANQAGREIAHKALKRIQEINDRAGLRATIATPVYSAEQVIAFEDRHFKHFRYTEPPEGQKSEILGQRIGAIELEIDDLTHSALSPSALEEGAEAQPEAKLKAKPEDNSSAEKPAQPASDIRTSNDWTMEE